VAALVLTPLLILLDETVASLGGGAGSSWVSGGLAPFALLSVLLGGWHLAMRKKGGASRGEALQGVFVFVTIALIVLTATGFWFRGEGMALKWPWR